jgi:hypothetical protein
MFFKPIDRMWERIENDKDNSDTDLFLALMYMGEMVTKLTASGLVAAVNEGIDRHRYRQNYQLVRANGIGDWSRVIDEVLSGATSKDLMRYAHLEQEELTSVNKEGTWQYDSVTLINRCLKSINPDTEGIQKKVSARTWFSTFATLRNSTRGHGAVPPGTYTQICSDFEKSLRLFVENFSLFQRSWAYLHQNLSGKYRVTKWTDAAKSLDFLKIKQEQKVSFSNGVYIHYDESEKLDGFVKVEPIKSDVDAVDFFFANGNFNAKTYELLSYITGNKDEGDGKSFLVPITNLPPSETEGLTELEARGEALVTVPPPQRGYIARGRLEQELYNELALADHHRIVTLVGRGGIGKTWLALNVLNRIANENRFAAILWFSARDYDLLPDGPKEVKPHVKTEEDVANEFARLVAPYVMNSEQFNSKEFKLKRLDFLRENLTQSKLGGPILFVFDNFETVKSPIELYSWIDTYLRLPNKVLITTRFRDFKGDNPVSVHGMNEKESEELIAKNGRDLGIIYLLTDEYKQELYSESEGHPYVLKILLGEVAKAKRAIKVERIIATQDDILETLFERTFSRLSPAGKRVFLTLCSWKSLIPQIALEAVLLRPSNEKMDVTGAVEELHTSSLIEITDAEEDNQSFLSVPLVALVFGQRKLATYPMESAVQADVEFLQYFGVAKPIDIQHGLSPRVERLFRTIAKRVSSGNQQIEMYLPILEFVARKYPPAWVLLANLYEDEEERDKAKDTLLRFLEFSEDPSENRKVWARLANLYFQDENLAEEIHARIKLCRFPETPYEEISNSANRLNSLFRSQEFLIDSDEKRIIVGELVELMENRLHEADATDCSRLAWLCIHLKDKTRARNYAEHGLTLDPDNSYCKKLLQSP